MSKKPTIIFLGTPEFAVPSLEILIQSDYIISAVVTVADKPSGRGQKLIHSPVKECALRHNLKVLQPTNLKDEQFIEELRSLNADLFIVVAFRMLPEAVWNMSKQGTFNLHGSLLPQYRGAAPINWSVINGDKKTGVTTFFLKKEIDTGNIILQDELLISTTDTVGTLHDKLMIRGADLVLKTVKAIESGKVKTIDQNTLMVEELKPAPKLNRENTRLKISMKPEEARNFIRGLSPYPAAHAELYNSNGIGFSLKIFSVDAVTESHSEEIGRVRTDGKNYVRVFLNSGYIDITELQISGRNRMSAKDFLNGSKLDGDWKINEI